MFIAVDGIDGSGKTTLVRQLGDYFGSSASLVTKEPTDQSKWGRILRDSAQKGRLDRETEIKYFHLDRIHHIKNEILPALSDGKVVITDRYVDSTLAFQTKTAKEADDLYESFLSEILVPNITFILNCTVEIGLSRIKSRDGDAISAFETREALEIADKIYTSRTEIHYAHLDATSTPEHTFDQAVKILVAHGLTVDGKPTDSSDVISGTVDAESLPLKVRA